MNRTRIRSEVFSREDIQNILRAIDSANRALAVHLPLAEVGIYRAGFTAAMEAVAAAFDIGLGSQLEEQMSSASLAPRFPKWHQ